MLKFIGIALCGLICQGCASSPKAFKEDQCYQPLYWPSELCEQTPRPPVGSRRPPRYGKLDSED